MNAQRNASSGLKNVALFLAAPFIGLFFIAAGPFIGIAALAWIGARALLRNPDATDARVSGKRVRRTAWMRLTVPGATAQAS